MKPCRLTDRAILTLGGQSVNISLHFLVQQFDAARMLFITIPTAAVPFGNAHFGAGTGTIYLDNVGCTGSETNLNDCSRSSSVSCFGGHSEDAGVRCQGLYYFIDQV